MATWHGAMIENGVVVNLAVFEGEITRDLIDGFGVEPCPMEVQKGWTFEGGIWTPPPGKEIVIERTQRVSPAQAKIALYNAGLLPTVEAMIAAHPYPPVRIWYEAASTWEIDHPYVMAFAMELGLSDEALQQLFDAARLL